MTDTAFEIHGLLFLFFFGGGLIFAIVSGVIFALKRFTGENTDQAWDQAMRRGLVALALMVAGVYFVDRAVTKVEKDGFIIEIEPRAEPGPPPPPAPAVRLS